MNQIQPETIHSITNSNAEIHRLIQTGMSPLATNQSRSSRLTGNSSGMDSSPSPIIRFGGHSMRNYDYSTCANHCKCLCHKKRYLNTPRILSKALGVLFVQYSAHPMGTPSRCMETGCQAHYNFKAQVYYWFPVWLLSKMMAIHFMLTLYNEPVVSLTVRAVLPGSADLFQFTILDETEGLQRLFSNRSASPNDVEVLFGDSPLLVSSIFHRNPYNPTRRVSQSVLSNSHLYHLTYHNRRVNSGKTSGTLAL